MSDDPYVYPGTQVLKNKLGIQDPEKLDRVERRFSAQRTRMGVPSGDFDLKHLQAIHGHIFQDVYDWAGKIRTVEISKGASQFQFRQYIETGMADVHRRIVGEDYLKGLSKDEFAAKAGAIMGDVNYVHPFREGNGRCQLLYLRQLASRAGHKLDISKIAPEAWLDASQRAHQADYEPMSKVIRQSLSDRDQARQGRDKGKDRGRE
jgi:cell filamentation protein